jgi:hypothetical protein
MITDASQSRRNILAYCCLPPGPQTNGRPVFAFHETSRCFIPDLSHPWFPTNQEVSYANPRNTLGQSFSDGFVRVNDATEQIGQRGPAIGRSASMPLVRIADVDG